MKIFRWGCYIYLACCLFFFIYAGERYSYYITGLFGWQPTHSEFAQVDLEHYDDLPMSCKLCKGGFATFKAFFGSNTTYNFLIPTVKSIGSITTGDSEMCEFLFDSYGNKVYSNLFYRLMDVDYQCFYVGLCDDTFYERDDENIYIKRMMDEQPPIDRKYPNVAPEEPIRMLQISDAHVDRGYLEGSAVECSAPS